MKVVVRTNLFIIKRPISNLDTFQVPPLGSAFIRTATKYNFFSGYFIHIIKKIREEIEQKWKESRGNMTRDVKRKHKSAVKKKEKMMKKRKTETGATEL